MGTFFAYAIQSAICLIIFYLFYKVLLSRETFHRFNRMALLGILLLSFIIPFTLTLFPIQQATAITPDISGFTDEISVAVSGGNNETEIAKNENGSFIFALILIIYLTGCMICLLYTAFSTIRIIRIIRKGTITTTTDGTKLIIVNDKTTRPFSWMNCIICSKSDYEEAGSTIITHEHTHIRLHHSLDLLIVQTGIITQWFNPAVWLLYRELQNIHEYEADEAVIRKGIDVKQYQLLLIKKAVGARLYSIANSLNHSNLKKRIAMMYQKKSNPWARLKYASVLPLAATAVALFAQPEISQPLAEISNAKVSHFSFVTGKNEVKNLPESEISDEPLNQPGEARLMEHVIVEDTTIFESAEIPALFPGGEAALLRWVTENLRYPVEAQESGIQGRVYCQFVIEKDGSVTNVEVTRSANQYLDEEAIRTLSLLPKFNPGMTKGKPVRVRYSVPVRFQISGTQINQESEIDENFIFVSADTQVQFPGGEKALMKWISDHLTIPVDANNNALKGRVYCQFIVEKDGSVSNVEITRGADPLLDAEAVRVLQTLPKFKPAEQRGQRVRCRYSVSVNFEPK